MKGDKNGRLFVCYKYRVKNSTKASVDVIYLRDPSNNFWYLNDSYAAEQFVEETEKRHVPKDGSAIDLRRMAATALGFLKTVVAGTHHRFELAP